MCSHRWLKTIEEFEVNKSDEFLNYRDNIPDFARHALNNLARRIRHLNSQISDIFFLDLPARMARTLILLADQHGRETSDGVVIDLTLTQTDLAEMTGAARVSINKAIGRFRQANWVLIQGREVTVSYRDAFENLIRTSSG